MDDTGHGLVRKGGAGYTMTWLGSGRWGPPTCHGLVQKGGGVVGGVGGGSGMTWLGSERWGGVVVV